MDIPKTYDPKQAEESHYARWEREGCFAPEVVARLALFLLQLPLDDNLRGDARMVCAGEPERSEASHAVVAREHVHDCVLQGVAHVERARNVRGRNDD